MTDPNNPNNPSGPDNPDDPYQPKGFHPPPPPQQPQPTQPGTPYYPPAPAVPPGYGYGQVAPQSVPPGMFLDGRSGLLLPQGTELASVGRRIGAWFLSILLTIVTLGIGYIIWGLIVWGRGQTPALQVLGMRVWRPDDRRPASWGYMALREIIGRIVDGVLSIVTELISFIMFCAGKQRKSLHDMVAGTVVLYDPNKVIAG